MRNRGILLVLVLVSGLVLAAGCSQPAGQGSNTIQATLTTAPVTTAPSGMITPAYLTVRVKEAVAFARANGKEQAVAAFNDPDGSFVRDNVYVFAEDYDGLALAEPFENHIEGTNIRNMTDRYGVPLVRRLGETAGYGTGYVSYDYPDPGNNNAIM